MKMDRNFRHAKTLAYQPYGCRQEERVSIVGNGLDQSDWHAIQPCRSERSCVFRDRQSERFTRKIVPFQAQETTPPLVVKRSAVNEARAECDVGSGVECSEETWDFQRIVR